MNRMPAKRLSVVVLALGLVAAATAPAFAQYRPMPSSQGGGATVKGEKYHMEVAGNLWSPPPDFTFKSEGLGIPGTEIDLDADLGLEQQQMWELRVVLRPAKKHKLRFHYLPMQYKGDIVLSKEFIFNGIRFPIRIPVKTDFQWKAYRFTYEYDVVYTERGFLGLLLESKYADVKLDLDSPISREFAQARSPIPAIGLVGRFYPLGFISISSEFTYFRLPNSVEEDQDAKLNVLDYDVYGTVNITNNFGVQGGYRSIDMGFRIKADEGAIKLKGPYFGGVVRF